MTDDKGHTLPSSTINKAIPPTKQTFLQKWMLWLSKYALLVIGVIFVFGITAMILRQLDLQASLVKDITLQNAEIYAKAFAEFRSLYTSEVVKSAREYGMTVSHDYREREHAIPLPATLTILLGNRIGKHTSGIKTSLYSAYPFPWRRDSGGLQNQFSQDAWKHLRENPKEPFYRIEEYSGNKIMRYAVADLMRPACVECHNTHPETPKNDWKTGDVRGVLEVDYPLGVAETTISVDTHHSTKIAFGSASAALIVLGLLLKGFRRSEKELVETIDERTGAFNASQALNDAIVDNAGEGIITIDKDGQLYTYNTAAAKIFGYSKNEVIDKHISVLIPQFHNLGHKGRLNLKIGIYQELIAKSKTGQEIPIEVHFANVTGVDLPLTVGVLRDLRESKTEEKKIKTLSSALLRDSRMAGMAEIATGMLHNVGNVLNSLNISTDLVLDRLQKSKATNLAKSIELLQSHADDLGDFLTKDAQGQQLIPYLEVLAKHFNSEQEDLLKEIYQAREHITHIKNVVTKQTDISKATGVVEPYAMSQLIDDAISMVALSLKYKNIRVVRKPEPKTEVTVDHHRVLEILINLLGNAQQSLEEWKPEHKWIAIWAELKETDRFCICVEENGRGIKEEDMEKIFNHGFTTKKKGHGFGLHNSANMATKMGGTLTCESKGLGKGAKFSLELPLAPPKRGKSKAIFPLA